MKMFVPDVGEYIRLTADWSLTLDHKWENADLLQALDLWKFAGPSTKVTLPAGTVLKIIKVETRGAQSAYKKSGVSLRTWAGPDKRLAPPQRGGNAKTARFFALLPDFNNLEYEVVIAP